MTTAEEGEFVEAFVELFPKARRVAYRLVGDVAASEDLAAEALARTFAHWADVKNLPHRDAWVLRVATNLALNHVGRRRHQMPAQPEQAAVDVVLRVALVQALRELSRRQREIIVLRHIVGMSEAEIAQVLGIGEGTVKTHTRRALDRLRTRLGDQFMEAADGA